MQRGRHVILAIVRMRERLYTKGDDLTNRQNVADDRCHGRYAFRVPFAERKLEIVAEHEI